MENGRAKLNTVGQRTLGREDGRAKVGRVRVHLSQLISPYRLSPYRPRIN